MAGDGITETAARFGTVLISNFWGIAGAADAFFDTKGVTGALRSAGDAYWDAMDLMSLPQLGQVIGQNLPLLPVNFKIGDIELYRDLLRKGGDAVMAIADSISAALETTPELLNRVFDFMSTSANAMHSIASNYEQATDWTPSAVSEATNFYETVIEWTADRFEDIARLSGVADHTALEMRDRFIAASEPVFERGMGAVKQFLSQSLESLQSAASGGPFPAPLALIASGQFLLNSFRPANATSDNFSAAQSFQYAPRDPLTFDLDGDGLETVGVVQSGVLFDHEGDGIRTATGWIKPDDGLLVLDRNGNGAVDSGQELFGDSTPLATGGAAADGFAALAQEDTNSDGIVSSTDTRWSQLRIWRDANQDGVSQTSELSTLGALGIASINVASTEHLQALADGNRIADLGSYTRTDGNVGTVATVGLAADVDLADNTFIREFADSVPIDDEVWFLPGMQGSGKVRDLREAATLSSDLKQALVDYSAATARATQRNLVDSVLLNWADTAAQPTMQARASTASNTQNPNGFTHEWAAIGNQAAASYQTGVDASGNPLYSAEWHALVQDWEERLHILEAFNGRTFFAFPGEDSPGADLGLSIQNGINGQPGKIITSLTQPHVFLLSNSYQALSDSVYGALTMQTRFKPILEALDLAVDAQGRLVVDSSAAQAALQARVDQNSVTGLQDVGDFTRYSGFRTVGAMLLESNIRTLALTPELQAVYDEFGITIEGNVGYSSNGTEAADIIVAGAGSNDIHGAGGNDLVFGGAGSDELMGGAGDDVLAGGQGDDWLYGSTNWGGDSGSDSYIFARGSGHDRIVDGGDTSNIDVIRLVGILPSELSLSRSINGNYIGSDLIISVNGTSDSITVADYFLSDWHKIEKVEFDDGSIWGAAELGNAAVVPTTSSLNGTNASDIFDLRNAGATMAYGATAGDSGNDSYIFGIGGGQDRISDYGAASDNVDTIKLVGILPANVTLTRALSGENVTHDLEISIIGTSDKLTVLNYFVADAHKIERVGFDNGTVWGAAELAQAAIVPTAGNNSIYGTVDGEIYDLRNAVSTRVTSTNGGSNSDSDTYIFATGSGEDRIHDYDTAAGNVDTIKIVGKLPSQVTINRAIAGDDVISDLVISINGTTDKLTVENYFESTGRYKIERVEFDDGTVLSAAQLALAPIVPGGTDYQIYGTSDAEVYDLRNAASTRVAALNGGSDSGNDTYVFAAGSGEDRIMEYGTAADHVDTIKIVGKLPSEVTISRPISNSYVLPNLVISINGTTDKLTVENHFESTGPYKIEHVEFDDGTVWGAAQLALAPVTPTATDNHIYGTSDAEVYDLRNVASTRVDSLNGGSDSGNDTYIFAAGSGQDTIQDYSSASGNIDTVKIVGRAPADSRLVRSVDTWGNPSNDLLIQLNGTADQLTIGNYFADTPYKIERVEFDDGTVWGSADLDATQILPAGNSVNGTSGTDFIDLRNAVHTWVGGPGAGNDTFLFAAGAGQDTISDYDGTAGNVDTIRLIGVLPSEVTVSRGISSSSVSNDLVFSVNGTSDRLTVSNYFTDGAYKVERVEFDDGTVWGAADFANVAVVPTVAGVVIGTNGADIFDLRNAISSTAHGSNSGDSGSDTYIFAPGAGQDTIYDYGTASGHVDTVKLTGVLPSAVALSRSVSANSVTNDLVISINGTADRLIVKEYFASSEYKIERVEFDDGTVWGTGELDMAAVVPNVAGTVVGTAGADTIDLRNAVATAAHGGYSGYNSGNDIYIFGAGAGQDSISDYGDVAGNIDKIKLVGVVPSDVALRRAISGGSITNDLVISISGTTDTLTVKDHFAANEYKIEQVEFDNGTVWGASELGLAAATPTVAGTVAGTAGADTIDLRNAVASAAHGFGYSGYNSGNDTYIFGVGAGQDSITDYGDAAGNIDKIKVVGVVPSDVTLRRAISGGSITNDLVISVNGTTDTLTVKDHFAANEYKIEQVEFDNGTVWGASELGEASVVPTVAGSVIATAGADTIDLRNAANNTIYGHYYSNYESGTDTYIWGVGGGQDLISEYGNTSGVDRIKLVGVLPSGISLSRAISGGWVSNDLVISINGTNDALTVKDYFAANEYKIEQVEFDNGAVWGASELDQAAAIPSVSAVAGGAGADTIDLRNAVSTVAYGYGYSGYNSGNDTYVFGAGAGQDSISDYGDAAGNIDKIKLVGVVPSDVTLKRAVSGGLVTNDLVISITGTSDTLTLKDYFAANEYKIERVEFDNGTVWGVTELSQAIVVPTVAGSVVGTGGADTFDLRNSVNNTIYGHYYSGYDTGDDTYLVGRGGGQDTVSEYSTVSGNIDIAKFDAGIAADQIWLRHVGNDLEVSIIGTSDKTTIQNWYSGSAYRVEQLKTADNKVLLDTQVETLVQAMASFAPPSAGQTTLPQDYQEALGSQIAANWQ